MILALVVIAACALWTVYRWPLVRAVGAWSLLPDLALISMPPAEWGVHDARSRCVTKAVMRQIDRGVWRGLMFRRARRAARDGRSERARSDAIALLGRGGLPGDVPLLVELSTDPSSEVRSAACFAMGAIWTGPVPREAVAALERRADDEREGRAVRELATSCLAEIRQGQPE